MNTSESSTTNKNPDLILVIDDDDDISNMLRIYLQACGYKVITANSGDGKAGLEKALNLQPDLVVLDPLEPGVEGFDVLEGIRKNLLAQNIPLMILRQLDERDSCLADLRDREDYITKPFDIEEVKLRIVSTIRRK